MILDLNDINKKEESVITSGIKAPMPTPPSGIPPSQKEIIKQVIFTTTEILIYPNGKVFPGKTRTWLKSAVYKPVRKQKKYSKKISKTKVGTKEEY